MSKELTKTENAPQATEAKAYRKPEYVVHSGDNAYRLEVHMPGIAKDAARITLDGNLLTIEADAPRVANEAWKAFRREIPQGDYKLVLELNVEIDDSKIAAKVAEGVLTVNLPLAAKAAKRAIEIK